MKITLWIAFTLLAALWTGAIVASTELTAWLATTVASGQTGDMINSMGQWPMPAWLSLWIDPVWAQEMQAAGVQVLGWFGQSGPVVGNMVSWLIPLLWIVWGLVLTALLAAALFGHFLLGKFFRRNSLARRGT